MVKSEHSAYIVTERLNGASLDRVIVSGWRATDAEAIDLLRAIADPLALAHENGIIHRDIKPGNVFIDELGWVRLFCSGTRREQFRSLDEPELWTQGRKGLGAAPFA